MSRADRQPFETDARLSWSLTGNHRARPRPARGDHCSLIGARPRLPGCSIVGLAGTTHRRRHAYPSIAPHRARCIGSAQSYRARRVAPRARCTTTASAITASSPGSPSGARAAGSGG
jgi:hypothetical protein